MLFFSVCWILMPTLKKNPNVPFVSAEGTDRFGNQVSISGAGPWNLTQYEAEALASVYGSVDLSTGRTARAVADSSKSDIEGFGHSYAAGLGIAPHGFVQVTADLLGVKDYGFGVSGSQVSYDNSSPGGWATVAQSHVLGRPSLFFSGYNDLAQGGTTRVNGPYVHALAFSLSYLAALGLYRHTDATVTYPTGTWTTFPNTQNYSTGTTLAQTLGAGSVQIAVPSSFPGGYIVCTCPAGFTNGSVISMTVDGVSSGNPASVDTRSASLKVASGVIGVYVMRTNLLSAGSHTIGLSFANVTAAAYFDSWMYHNSTSPSVLAFTHPYLPRYDFYSPPFPVTDAALDTLNFWLTGNVGGLIPAVRVVNSNAILQRDPANFQLDSLHPNVTGHAKLGAAAAKLLA